MKKYLLGIFLIANISVWHNCFAQVDPEPVPKIILSSEIVKAASIAYREFQIELSKQKKAATNDFARMMAKLESYRVEIFERSDRYVIRFDPNIDGTRGGRIDYHVDKRKFILLDVDYSK